MKKSVTILVILVMTMQAYSVVVYGQNETTWSSGSGIIRNATGRTTNKREWIRDDENRQTLYLFSNWDGKQWKESTRTEYHYDSYGNPAEITKYTPDAAGSWIGMVNMSFDFNDNGTVKSTTIKQRNLAQEWYVADKKIFEYGGNNEITAIHVSFLTTANEHYTFDYQYDASGNCIVQTAHDAVKNTPTMKVEYGYDTENNLISTHDYQWLDSWDISSKTEYQYDINKNRTEGVFFNYLGFMQTWEPVMKRTYRYDENNRIIELSLFDWNIVRRDWNTVEKVEYGYDESGNIALLSGFESGQWRSDWALAETITFSYENPRFQGNTVQEMPVSVYFDASLSLLIISGAAGAKAVITDTSTNILLTRSNISNIETIPFYNMPEVIIVNIQKDDKWLTRTIVK